MLPPPTTTTSLPRIEEAVAGGAGRDAEALELALRGQAEPFGLGAGRDDQGIAGIGIAGIAFQAEGALLQVHLGDMVGDHLGAHIQAMRRCLCTYFVGILLAFRGNLKIQLDSIKFTDEEK